MLFSQTMKTSCNGTPLSERFLTAPIPAPSSILPVYVTHVMDGVAWVVHDEKQFQYVRDWDSVIPIYFQEKGIVQLYNYRNYNEYYDNSNPSKSLTVNQAIIFAETAGHVKLPAHIFTTSARAS